MAGSSHCLHVSNVIHVLTNMSDNGTALRIIQEVSGHRDLRQLQNYLEVQDLQVLGAVASLSILSPAP
jgi:integrase/recombinase XerD